MTVLVLLARSTPAWLITIECSEWVHGHGDRTTAAGYSLGYMLRDPTSHHSMAGSCRNLHRCADPARRRRGQHCRRRLPVDPRHRALAHKPVGHKDGPTLRLGWEPSPPKCNHHRSHRPGTGNASFRPPILGREAEAPEASATRRDRNLGPCWVAAGGQTTDKAAKGGH
jgi:hypothetical protein